MITSSSGAARDTSIVSIYGEEADDIDKGEGGPAFRAGRWAIRVIIMIGPRAGQPDGGRSLAMRTLR